MLENAINEVMDLLKRLTPLSRTLVHPDNDLALKIIGDALGKGLSISSYPSGQKVWTWRIPNEWQLQESKIEDAKTGELLWDGTSHPLATVNYSLSFSGELTAKELAPHLYSAQDRPNAIPFVFRFYNRDWGFCLPESIRNKILQYDRLRVNIIADELPGSLKIGTLTLPGASEKEFIICTNICHPSIANDSISGAAVALALVKYLRQKSSLKYTYRFLWLPETIGSVAYLANNEDVIERAIGGLFLEMLGNENSLCLQFSRSGNSYWDKVAKSTLVDMGCEFRTAAFLQSASNDEKVFDSPGVDIPMISITRFPYPEYHTSDDNIDLISCHKIKEAIDFMCLFLDRVESDYIPNYLTRGPVCLAENGLYPDWYRNPEKKDQWEAFLKIMYSLDGKRSVEVLANDLCMPVNLVHFWFNSFIEKGFIKKSQLKW